VSAVRHLRIVPDNTSFGFVRFRRFSFPASAVLSILALVFFFTHGLNYGIDFKGGISMQVTAISGKSDIPAMRTKLEPLQLGEIQMQEFGTQGQVLIRIAQQPGGDAAQQVAADKVKTTLGSDYRFDEVQVIGPSVSQELVTVGTVGIFVAIACILVYLWFRFDWQFAVGAMIANIHDIALTIGFMSVTQIDFDLTSVAALLTILGYSLNDTVVIYDRIRELLRKYKRLPMTELLDNSINATLSRSVITHVTVALALLALLLFGGHAIHSFTATMLFGVVLVGTYTSIFIASPILIYLGLRPGSHSEEAGEKAAG
jgi:preprotein translocase subunit SecF